MKEKAGISRTYGWVVELLPRVFYVSVRRKRLESPVGFWHKWLVECDTECPSSRAPNECSSKPKYCRLCHAFLMCTADNCSINHGSEAIFGLLPASHPTHFAYSRQDVVHAKFDYTLPLVLAVRVVRGLFTTDGRQHIVTS